jgi:hypothetical protein
MEKQFFNILNPIHLEVIGKPVDQSIYNTFVKTLRLDRSPASLARIKEKLIMHRDKINDILTSPNDRQIFMLSDETIQCNALEQFETSNKKLLLLCVPHNFEENYSNVEKFFNDTSSIFEKVNFFFLTNNNSDDTDNVLKKWCQKYPNKCDGIFIKNIANINPTNRLNYLSSLKNQCFSSAKNRFGIDFDYVVYLDDNIVNEINMNDFLSSFQLNSEWDIICGNRVFNKSYYHADLLHLRLLDEPYVRITDKFTYLDRFYGKSLFWIDKLYMFNTWYKVAAAYGGIIIMNNKVLKLTSLWDDSEYGNVSLCTKFLNVYVNPQLLTENKINIEGILYQNPYNILPSNLDFFGVLNEIIGSLNNGFRIYPYWNYEKVFDVSKNDMINFSSHMDHDVENNWFDYFDPIQFYKNDTTHHSDAIQLFSSYSPNPSFMETNRQNLNVIFKKFFKPNKTVTTRVEELMTHVGQQPEKEFIGVIYNHPANTLSENVSFTKIFEKIKSLHLGQDSFKIFLVTDTDLALAAFQKEYGENSVVFDPEYKRYDLDDIIEWGSSNTKRQYKHYNCNHGVDLLTNAIFISKRCKWCISAPCNILKTIGFMSSTIEIVTLI